MEVLVIGASGTLGHHVADVLEQRGHNVRRGSRRPRPDWFLVDVLNVATFEKSLAGVDAIVHCGADPLENARLVEETGLRRLRAAAPTARIVYPSIVGCDKVALAYYKIKFDAEAALLHMGGNHGILRLTQFHEFADRLAHMPVPAVPLSMTAQTISAREAAEAIADAVESDEQGMLGNVGGPEIHRMVDLVKERLAFDGKGWKPVLQVPKGTKGFRAGGNLCPNQRVGKITWREHLFGSPETP